MLPFSLRSAQRLSASEMKTPLGEETEAYEIECSTPFGIRDENTCRISSGSVNAPSCAQRLSASEMKTPRASPRTSPCPWSAQRLSASEMKTRKGAYAGSGLYVCSTPFGIRDENTLQYSTVASLLVGAQRLSASEMKTHVLCRPWGGLQFVLNAFRHQR